MPVLRKAQKRRSRNYRRLHADPAIARATHFFAAAAEVTRVLGRCRPSPFLDELGAMLEAANLERARLIVTGRCYSCGSTRDNTADFVRFEQRLVQARLDVLRQQDACAYHAAIRQANGEIARAGGFAVRWLHPVFARAAGQVRSLLGRPIDFARLEDRELLGNAIAREACPATDTRG